MSKENLRSFLEHVAKDKEVSDKVQEYAKKGYKAVIDYAAELGYVIDEKELNELDRQVEQGIKKLKERSKNLLIDIDGEENEGMKNLKSFIKLSEENNEVKNKLKELSVGEPSAMISYGKEMGYEFTENDLEELGKRLLEQSEELSDEELENVAGGVLTFVLAAGVAVGAGAVLGVGAGAVMLGATAVAGAAVAGVAVVGGVASIGAGVGAAVVGVGAGVLGATLVMNCCRK